MDLFCGLGGWTKGFLAEGYDCIGFDIERRPYPGQLVLQDVLTLDGAQFRRAACIVASPPCQAYSYRAMPWKRAKALPPPSNELFDACFRIQREASEAAGHHVPLVVENVCGAQKWVGRARWHFGSYYLWGDVPALMPPVRTFKGFGGSWFAQNHNTNTGGRGNPANGTGVKQHGSGAEWFDKALDDRRREATAHLKRPGISLERDGMNNYPKEADGYRTLPDGSRVQGRENARKAASALIAEIPFDLAQWIARCFKPEPQQSRKPISSRSGDNVALMEQTPGERLHS